MLARLRLIAAISLAAWLGTSVFAQDHVLGHQKISNAEGWSGVFLKDEDQLGSSVALLGDLNADGVRDWAVGAPYTDDGAYATGATWVLLMNADGTVRAEQKLSEIAGGMNGAIETRSLFGSAVARLGDLDGDGVDDLAVGAKGDEDGIYGANIGAVWILFMNADGSVRSKQRIANSAGGFGGTLDHGDYFGQALANMGDLDADGVDDLAVGACWDDDGGPSRGAVWILFMNADGTVKNEQKISQTAGGFGGVLDDEDLFGCSLARLGDLDDDGVEDLAVGAYFDDDGGPDRGAVWILFMNADGTVKDEQKISETTGGFGSILDNIGLFGSALAPLGDLDGDGVEDLAVGNAWDYDGGNRIGAVWILFLNANGTVKSEQKISATSGGFGGALEMNDWFGWSLASLEDHDADGVTDLAVGAVRDDDGGYNHGAVWIVHLNTDGTVKDEQKVSETSGGFGRWLRDDDHFGSSLASTGDLDGNGVIDALAGASGQDGGGTNRGRAELLLLADDGTVLSKHFLREGAANALVPLDDGDGFGSSAACLGDLDADGIPELAVGAPGDDDGGGGCGAVWVLYLGTDHHPRAATKISATAGGFAGALDSGDLFGFAATNLADLDGDGLDELVVGAPGDDDGGTNRGAVWILFLDAAGAVRDERKISDAAGGFGGGLADTDVFGSAVASVGDLDGDGIEELAVGAPGDDGGGVDRGAVWLLYLDSTGAVRAKTRVAESAGIDPGDLDDGDRFGTSLASDHDLDGDGYLDLLVGTPLDDDGGVDRGALWILLLDPTTTLHGYGKISDEAGEFGGTLDDGDGFGGAVAMHGDVDGDGHADLLAGASLDDDEGSDCGALWVLFCDEISVGDASATWRNGSGMNPDVFVSTSLPILGTNWTSTVDGGLVGATGLVFVVGYSGMLPGLMTPVGELLIDPSSDWVFTSFGALGGVGISNHAVLIPNDHAFVGLRASVQAILNNVGGSALLVNAWDIVVGY